MARLASVALLIILGVHILSTVPIFLVAMSAFAYSNDTDFLDKRNVAETFDFGSGLFAAILFALSLMAYRTMKLKRLLLVSFAFALFATYTIVSRLEIFGIEIESTFLEIILAVLNFVALLLFFLAIVKKQTPTSKFRR